MSTVTIPKGVTKGEELIIISRKEYERFLRFEKKKETVTEEDILRWSREARKLYKAGKLPALSSLKDLRQDMNISYTSRFQNAYKKLPIAVKRKAERVETLFRKDAFNPRLKTHKLHGKLKDQWSFSIDRENRIVFEFVDKFSVIFLDVGDHDIYL